jgi:hypothetical protein
VSRAREVCCRFLKSEGENALFWAVGNNAEDISKVNNSSSARFAGNCSCFTGDFDHGVRQLDVAAFGVEIVLVLAVESILEFVCIFLNFPGEGEGDDNASRFRGTMGRFSDDMLIGIPSATGAEEPLNQEVRPLVRSSILMTPSLSPVNVGMKPSSCVFASFPRALEGLSLLLLSRRSGDFDIGERMDGRREVRLLCCTALGRLVMFSSSSYNFRGDVCAAGNGESSESPSNSRSRW